MHQNSTKKQKLPYYASFFQGGDYIINIYVDEDANINKKGFGYIQNIWIQYKDEHKWLINLRYPNHNVICTDSSRKFLRTFDLNNNHKKYVISLDDMNIIATTKKRALNLQFKNNFFKNNQRVKEYYGAAVSQKQLRYLKNLKEILI